MRTTRPVFVLVSCLVGSLLFTGCSSSFDSIDSPPGATRLGTIQGIAHGGRQPISGARVYLLEANNTQDAGPGSAGSSNASKSLLDSDAGNGADSIGYYVLTGEDGSFTMTGDYTPCDTGEQVYLYSVGGDAGGGVNSAAGLMAVLGTCGSFPFTASTMINMNEVSTIAAGYAMAGYANDATHVGYDGTALAKTGIANAFANANQLFDITTNTGNTPARATTPNGNGTVPQKQIDTLANILAACIDSDGPSSSQCATLLGGLQSAGATGTEATDTATEAIYMAHNPSITSVYSATGSGPNPYTPWFNTAAPSDLTIALTFTGGGVTRTNSDPATYSESIAIDANGSVWTVNYSANNLSKFSPLGIPASGSPFSSNNDEPAGLAISSTGNVWVANHNGFGTLSVFNNDGSDDFDTPNYDSGPVGANLSSCLAEPTHITVTKDGTSVFVSGYGPDFICFVGAGAATHQGLFTSQIDTPSAMALDGSGDIWTGTRSGAYGAGPQMYELHTNANINGSPFTGSQIGYTRSVAVDQNNNAWFSSDSNMVEITSAGSVGPAITGGGINEPNGVAIDGNNTIWETDFGTQGTGAPVGDGAVIALNSSGAILSGAAGYQSASGFAGQGIAIDGSGNIWVDNLAANSIRELIGVAAPVVTPIAAATVSGTMAARP